MASVWSAGGGGQLSPMKEPFVFTPLVRPVSKVPEFFDCIFCSKLGSSHVSRHLLSPDFQSFVYVNPIVAS